MTKKELEEKFENISDIEGLVNAVRYESDPDVIMEAFKEYGLDINEEDIKDLSLGEEEIAEEQLEAVAGGCSCGGPLQHLVWKFLNWAVGKRNVGCM